MKNQNKLIDIEAKYNIERTIGKKGQGMSSLVEQLASNNALSKLQNLEK
jgi:hypothetical protein